MTTETKQLGSKELALVTGASGGIGLEMAKILAARGHDLILVARDKEKLQKLAEELSSVHKISAQVTTKDLAKRGAPKELFEQLKSEKKLPTVLVNNAGYGDFGPFIDATEERVQGMIQVNISSLTELTHLFLPSMVKKGKGKILNVASTAAFQPGPLMAVYYATKAYVLSFSEAIANELEGTGVTVTALCPGPTESGFQKTAKMEESRLVRIKSMMMDSKSVAEMGIKGMLAGRRVVVTGFANKLAVFSVRLTPRSMVTKLVRRIQEKAH